MYCTREMQRLAGCTTRTLSRCNEWQTTVPVDQVQSHCWLPPSEMERQRRAAAFIRCCLFWLSARDCSPPGSRRVS